MKPLRQAVYSSRSADKFVVRLPDGMRERIAARARIHHRSMNSEIVMVLEKEMATPEDAFAADMARHTSTAVTTPVVINQLAYYRLESDGEYHLGVIQGIAVSIDDVPSVTFDKTPPHYGNMVIGSIAADPRHWFAMEDIKPYLI